MKAGLRVGVYTAKSRRSSASPARADALHRTVTSARAAPFLTPVSRVHVQPARSTQHQQRAGRAASALSRRSVRHQTDVLYTRRLYFCHAVLCEVCTTALLHMPHRVNARVRSCRPIAIAIHYWDTAVHEHVRPRGLLDTRVDTSDRQAWPTCRPQRHGVDRHQRSFIHWHYCQNRSRNAEGLPEARRHW